MSLCNYLLQFLNSLWLMQAPGMALMGVGPIDQVPVLEQPTIHKGLSKALLLR